MCIRAKEYLREIKKRDMAIQHMVKELDEIRTMQSFIGSIDYAKDRVQTSAGEASYTTIIEKLVDTQNRINKEIDRYVDYKHDAISRINSLDKVEHSELLYKRYIEYKSLEQISCEMCLSYYRVCHLHGDALQSFNKTIER